MSWYRNVPCSGSYVIDKTNKPEFQNILRVKVAPSVMMEGALLVEVTEQPHKGFKFWLDSAKAEVVAPPESFSFSSIHNHSMRAFLRACGVESA